MRETLHEINVAGYVGRWLDHRCGKKTCSCQQTRPKVVVVADETGPDMWFPIGEHTGPVRDVVVTAMEEAIGEPQMWEVLERVLPLFGLPWSDLVRPLIVQQMAMLQAVDEEWFFAQSPERFEKLRGLCKSLESVERSFGVMREYELNVGGRKVILPEGPK